MYYDKIGAKKVRIRRILPEVRNFEITLIKNLVLKKNCLEESVILFNLSEARKSVIGLFDIEKGFRTLHNGALVEVKVVVVIGHSLLKEHK